MAICWICGDEATTGEHLIKKSDLKQVFSKPSPGAPLFLHNKKRSNVKIQGLNAKALKLEKSLCAPCNNTLTQPYDRAWETLSAFLASRNPKLRPGSIVRADRVYKTHSNQQMRYVQLFFVKLFGCLVKSNSIDLDTSSFARSLQDAKFHPQVSLKIGIVPREEQIVGVASVNVAKENTTGVIIGAQWFYELHDIAILVIYSPIRNLWTISDGAWSPRFKSGRILIHDFAPLLKGPEQRS